ncbi:SdiA-regulated domain-containing protein [Pseudomonas sp. NPDC089401]|uniref:SdiA-regulated domain-containing protein n=1 Tax=Pseudomonas sp. NPDC089401 TaxID=3364462 RepID=UPI0037F9BCB0
MRLSIKFALGVVALLIILVVARGGWFIYQYQLLDRWKFNISHENGGVEGNLEGYKPVVQARKVDGNGLSSLTYNTDTNTLFTIGDDTPEILELTTEGEVLRRIPTKGFDETEAIEYIGDGKFLVLEEPHNRISIVEIGPETKVLDSYLSRISVEIELNDFNKNFEGLAYSKKLKRIYVGKERDPVRIYEIDGFVDGKTPTDIVVRGNTEREKGLFIKDLSGLETDPKTGHLLVLSHESRLITELDDQGKPISTLSLLALGSGLDQLVQQAEGIAFGPDGTLYVMSEPNLFYSFKRDTK